MRRRDLMKALGFSFTTLGTGGYIAYSSVQESEPECFDGLELDEFYERLGTHEGEELYDPDYDITGNGAVGEADLEIYSGYLDSEYKPELAMYCGIEEGDLE